MSGMFNFTDGKFFDFGEPLQTFSQIIPMYIILGLIFLMIGAVVWSYDESGYGLTAYLILVGTLGTTATINTSLSMFFGVMLAMGIAMIFYKIYESRRSIT